MCSLLNIETQFWPRFYIGIASFFSYELFIFSNSYLHFYFPFLLWLLFQFFLKSLKFFSILFHSLFIRSRSRFGFFFITYWILTSLENPASILDEIQVKVIKILDIICKTEGCFQIFVVCFYRKHGLSKHLNHSIVVIFKLIYLGRIKCPNMPYTHSVL